MPLEHYYETFQILTSEIQVPDNQSFYNDVVHLHSGIDLFARRQYQGKTSQRNKFKIRSFFLSYTQNSYRQCYRCNINSENPAEKSCDKTHTGALTECDEGFNGCKIETEYSGMAMMTKHWWWQWLRQQWQWLQWQSGEKPSLSYRLNAVKGLLDENLNKNIVGWDAMMITALMMNVHSWWEGRDLCPRLHRAVRPKRLHGEDIWGQCRIN